MTGYLISQASLISVVSVGSAVLGIFIYFLEILIQVLQAYIFTLLFAVYVQGALQEGH
jgi:F-type H+-transporting ATPase subunit a